MDAGIKLNEDVMNQFNEMKICKKGHARKKFIFLHLNSTEEFLVLDESHECQQQRTSDPYQQLLTLLPEKKCCLVIYDFTYDTKESLNKNELVLILWCPNGASMKQKIQFTSTMNMVKAKLSGWLFSAANVLLNLPLGQSAQLCCGDGSMPPICRFAVKQEFCACGLLARRFQTGHPGTSQAPTCVQPLSQTYIAQKQALRPNPSMLTKMRPSALVPPACIDPYTSQPLLSTSLSKSILLKV